MITWFCWIFQEVDAETTTSSASSSKKCYTASRRRPALQRSSRDALIDLKVENEKKQSRLLDEEAERLRAADDKAALRAIEKRRLEQDLEIRELILQKIKSEFYVIFPDNAEAKDKTFYF